MKGISMRNTWIIAVCLAALLPAWGQSSPVPDASRRADFAGTWHLDLKKSFLGADHPDADYGFTRTIELKGSTLVQKDHEVNVDIIGFAIPVRNSTDELIPDGQKHTVQRPGYLPSMPSSPTQVTVEWQGDNLVVSEVGESFIGSVKASRRYYLSDDGKELIELIVGHTTYGDSEQRLVFTRVSP